MRPLLSLSLLATLAGCGEKWEVVDLDGDGYTVADGDCDESDATGPGVHPGADDAWYDGVDSNCDGANDFDKDGDGFVDPQSPDATPDTVDCWDDDEVPPEGYAPVAGVALLAADVHPGAQDSWYDGVDADCAGNDDFDQDGDQFRSSTHPDATGAFGDDCFDSVDDEYPGEPACDVTDVAHLDPALIHPGADDELYDGTDADCNDDPDDGVANDFDADGDGFAWCDECDDDDANASPNDEPEVWYDGVDGNCDGHSDFDKDGDGHDTVEHGGDDCWDDPDVIPDGFVSITGVQPTAAEVFPGAPEVWYDNVDGDCAGDDDFDQDLDGQDSANDPQSDGTVGDDCDDLEPTTYLGADDAWYDGVDSDCAGNDDFDADGDRADSSGFGGTDCDDGDALVHPGATETCGTAYDDDCDGDTNDLDALECTDFFLDSDGDGFGDAETQCTCAPAAPYTATDATDCDDASAGTHPGATESVDDGVDEDCNSQELCYVDSDSDGYRNEDTTLTVASADLLCTGAGEGASTEPATDCDDARATVYPSATESVDDGIDENCDGGELCYVDADGDGYRTTDSRTVASSDLTCTGSGEGQASDAATDCNDTVAAINPSATEVCDSSNTDEDCDGLADNNDSSAAAAGKTTFYRDSDADGYGLSTSTGSYCDLPSGYSTLSTDCNDSVAAINPAATEVCDSANTDEDCDGTADNNDSSASATTKTTFYRDSDGDGYGTSSTTGSYCDLPSGYSTLSTDCNDASSSISPAATEVCDSANTDEDCDGTADNNDSSASAATKTTFYRDADSDGYGTSSTTGAYCDLPTGYSTLSTDCNDASSSISPAATEVCDASNTDEDCDGTADNNDTSASAATKTTFYRDADGDGYGTSSTTGAYCDLPTGYATSSTDCNDSSSAINPAATEVCDASNTDEDCDGTADNNDSSASAATKTTYYLDSDGDGYGRSTSSAAYCDLPTGYSASSTDCLDTNASVNPGATELCDGIDDDCDGASIATDEAGKISYTTDGTTFTNVTSFTSGSGTAASPYMLTVTSGRTYYVCDGTYYLRVSSSAGATASIIGRNGASSTILSAGSASSRGAVVSVTAGGALTLQGLTLQDGLGNTISGYTWGGAVAAYASSAPSASSPTVAIDSCTLSGNAAQRGGAVMAYGYALVTVTDSTVTSNSATDGGAFYVLNQAELDLDGTTVSSNTATGDGGGFYSTNYGAIELVGSSSVTGNSAVNGAGAYLASTGELVLTNSTMASNHASGSGGAAYLAGAGGFTMTNSAVSSNDAAGHGGGVYMGSGAQVACTGSTGAANYGIFENTATLSGGAIYSSATGSASGSLAIDTCDFGATGSAYDNDPDDFDLHSGVSTGIEDDYSLTATCTRIDTCTP